METIYVDYDTYEYLLEKNNYQTPVYYDIFTVEPTDDETIQDYPKSLENH